MLLGFVPALCDTFGLENEVYLFHLVLHMFVRGFCLCIALNSSSSSSNLGKPPTPNSLHGVCTMKGSGIRCEGDFNIRPSSRYLNIFLSNHICLEG